MKTSGIFLVIFFLLVLSCKKDKIISNNGNLTFGNYSNMIVKKYETLIVGSYRSPKSFNLDVNKASAEWQELIEKERNEIRKLLLFHVITKILNIVGGGSLLDELPTDGTTPRWNYMGHSWR